MDIEIQRLKDQWTELFVSPSNLQPKTHVTTSRPLLNCSRIMVSHFIDLVISAPTCRKTEIFWIFRPCHGRFNLDFSVQTFCCYSVVGLPFLFLFLFGFICFWSVSANAGKNTSETGVFLCRQLKAREIQIHLLRNTPKQTLWNLNMAEKPNRHK